MELPSRQPLKLRPRVDFRPEDFRKLMFQRGLRVQWEQTNECPCGRLTKDVQEAQQLGHELLLTGSEYHGTAEPNLDCEMCKGRGYILHSSQTIRTLVTRGTESPQPYRPYGEVATGSAYFTFLPEHLPAMYDRITLLDTVIVFRETLVRTEGSIQETRYPIRERTLDLATGTTTATVLHCQAASKTGETKASNTLQAGTDFTVSSGKLDWTLGDANNKAPGVGAKFSIAYYGNPRYIITDHPHAFRDAIVQGKSVTASHTPMPVQASGRLDFLPGDAHVSP